MADWPIAVFLAGIVVFLYRMFTDKNPRSFNPRLFMPREREDWRQFDRKNFIVFALALVSTFLLIGFIRWIWMRRQAPLSAGGTCRANITADLVKEAEAAKRAIRGAGHRNEGLHCPNRHAGFKTYLVEYAADKLYLLAFAGLSCALDSLGTESPAERLFHTRCGSDCWISISY